MKVGQRAYLSVEHSSLSTALESAREYLLHNLPDLRFVSGPYVALVEHSFTVRNLGNTPAEITSIRIDLQQDGWLNPRDIYIMSPVNIGPKEELQIHRTIQADVTDTAAQLYSLEVEKIKANHPEGDIPSLYSSPFYTTLTLSYFDVFQETHKIQWHTTELFG